jgi:hypothetical protein
MKLHVQQPETEKNLTANKAPSSFGKSGRKAPGTRIGTLMDWREGSTKSGKLSGRYGHALRDGR